MFDLYNFYEIIFQLRLLMFVLDVRCSSTMFLRRFSSKGSQDLTERLTFLMLSHLNMQLAADTPGINSAIYYQSSLERSFSRSVMQCRSAYLETVQIKILRSS